MMDAVFLRLLDDLADVLDPRFQGPREIDLQAVVSLVLSNHEVADRLATRAPKRMYSGKETGKRGAT